MVKAWKSIAFLVLASGCAPEREGSFVTARAEARKAIGVAAPYEPEELDAPARERLRTSIRERRAFAWRAVAKALAPRAMDLPAWATWYARDDFARMFHRLYEGIGKNRRAARDVFQPPELAEALAWNLRAVDELPHWPSERYDEWLASLDTESKRRGAAGLSRTFYSPAATTPWLDGYARAFACLPELPTLDFAWKSPDPANFTFCFPHEFPRGAAVAKTAWKRRDFGMKVPVFDTAADALAKRLERPDGAWGAADREAEPSAAEIYTVETESGATFQLAALHLMTKELREWAWITLWWSDEPDGDFGEDRPAEILNLGGPWSHYKMCVVTTFRDEDEPDADWASTYPSLAAAVAAANRATAPFSWCSNPHVEAGASNHRSNCMGCHQHGGSTLEIQDILTDAGRFPGHGSARVRENFPSDYLWSFGREPENLSGYIRRQIDHYDVYDRL